MTAKLSVCPTLRYKDAKTAIALLKEAFGFTEVAVYENAEGVVEHAELAYGNGMVMLGTVREDTAFGRAAKDLGPVSVYVAVDDPDAHHARARSYGVAIVREPADQEYGSRDYLARDAEGNLWTFGSYAPELPAG